MDLAIRPKEKLALKTIGSEKYKLTLKPRSLKEINVGPLTSIKETEVYKNANLKTYHTRQKLKVYRPY